MRKQRWEGWISCSLRTIWRQKFMTQLWLCPRTPFILWAFCTRKKSLLLQVLRTIHPALHDNSQAKLYQRENQKGLTDEAAGTSAARWALFWLHSVGLNKQILRKVYRPSKWKAVGGDKSCQWAPHITAGCRRCFKTAESKGGLIWEQPLPPPTRSKA